MHGVSSVKNFSKHLANLDDQICHVASVGKGNQKFLIPYIPISKDFLCLVVKPENLNFSPLLLGRQSEFIVIINTKKCKYHIVPMQAFSCLGMIII